MMFEIRPKNIHEQQTAKKCTTVKMEKDKGFVYHANRQFTVVTKNTNQQSNFVSHLFKHQWTFTKTKAILMQQFCPSVTATSDVTNST